MEKLPQADRRMMTYRYDSGHNTEEIMERMEMTRRTLFRNLERVRATLADCITNHLKKEDFA